MKENYKENNLFVRQFRHNNPSFNKCTIYDWINWLMAYKFLFKKRGTEEFVLSESYLKCLQQNAKEIINMCDELDKEKLK